jgi:hypothetical protein
MKFPKRALIVAIFPFLVFPLWFLGIRNSNSENPTIVIIFGLLIALITSIIIVVKHNNKIETILGSIGIVTSLGALYFALAYIPYTSWAIETTWKKIANKGIITTTRTVASPTEAAMITSAESIPCPQTETFCDQSPSICNQFELCPNNIESTADKIRNENRKWKNKEEVFRLNYNASIVQTSLKTDKYTDYKYYEVPGNTSPLATCQPDSQPDTYLRQKYGISQSNINCGYGYYLERYIAFTSDGKPACQIYYHDLADYIGGNCY